MTEPIHVLLVDDNPLVLSSFRHYFNSTDDIVVVAEASNGEEALARLREHDVDVILADIHMPTMDGPTLLENINKLDSRPIFIAVTAFDSDRTMMRIIRLGGAGYVLKSEKPQVLIDAVRAATDGGMVVSPQAMTRLATHLKDDQNTDTYVDPISEAMKLQSLSKSERKVLVLLCQGMSNSEIAQDLAYSESTIKKYVSNIMDQFGATSRLNLVVKVLNAEY
ncbi:MULTISPECIES: response regulator [Corynebacterium]|uniref:response regulator n=1 Tax=Corynebacterium TaxID=1716 RepID=UPI00223A913D|nr:MULTISPECIES: response regulator transcription factor [Corynebacterium]MCT1499968.1 response regulator transcription factor [Corynebacterium sanguinis]MCT1598394.1 response regulator transcription factor [Corynebacterium sanguinis]MCT1629147.1 response regulator transcription factor [Corynebacterium sanguinis]WNI12169.1 response regulator transcription factor [Corynebacterium sp. Z-1]